MHVIRFLAAASLAAALVRLGGAEPPVTAADGAAAPSAVTGAVRLTRPPRTFSIAAVGDLLPESMVVAAAAEAATGTGLRYDPAALFEAISPIVQWADLGICHVETPIGRPGAAPGVYGRSSIGGFLLLGPNELAAGIAETGFDRCSTASNHSNDFGLDGVISTLDALDAAGVGHAGTSRSPAEVGPHPFTVNGIQIAHLAYTRYSNTGWPVEWLLDTAKTIDRVVADIRAARAGGAEVVIVSMHLGYELQSSPLPGDRAFVEQLTSEVPIDLVIEHGPHVVQPVERVNGTIVYWSVGNLVSGMGVPGRGKYSDLRILDGLMATVRFTEVTPGRFEATTIPITVCTDAGSKHVYAPLLSLRDNALQGDVRVGLAACLARTQQVVPSAI